jgi:fatty-acyl-CoA synthase
MFSLSKFYDKLLRRNADKTAIKFQDEKLSYTTVEKQTAQLANVFRSMGMRAGDSIAILTKNRPEYLISEIAAIRAGTVAIPLNSRLEKNAIRSMLSDAGARILVVGPTYFPIGKNLLQDNSFDINYIIGIEGQSEFPIGFHNFENLLSKAEQTAPTIASSPEDVAAMYYTGGTTGEPKGAMHTHRGLILNTYSHIAELEIGKQERALLTTPLGHSAGYIARAILTQGGTVVLAQGYEPNDFLKTVEKEQITWSFLVPTMISELLNTPVLDETDIGSFKTLVYGASSIPSTVLKDGIEKLGQIFIQIYGLTEVPNLVSVLPKQDHDPEREEVLLSSGFPVQLANVSIIDQEDRWDDDIGEITVTSPYSMKGYRKQEALIGDQGRIRTGDLGRIGEDGRLFLLDRIQDVIVSDGQLVFPSEVENVLQRHPEISQVAVIGTAKNKKSHNIIIKDRMNIEQTVRAVVVTDTNPTLDNLQKFCNKQGLAEHQIPQTMDTVGELPATPYGKIDKNSLRKPYW